MMVQPMKDYEIVADSPDLLVLAQRRTRNLSTIAPPVIIGVAASLALIFHFRVEPWIAIVVPAAATTAVLLVGFWLFQGVNAIKVDKATHAVTTLARRWLPPFERVEYLLPFDEILHAGLYPYADVHDQSTMLGMETKEGIVKLLPKAGEAEGQLLAKIVTIADHLATADPKASQQGREPGHVVTAVEYAPSTVATGSERGSAGFGDARQGLLDGVDRLVASLREDGSARGEGRVPARQDILEILRSVERKILALGMKVSGFAMAAQAGFFHAFVALGSGSRKHVQGVLSRARYNLLRA
ncbi:MAG: hypothetical protein JW839_16430 [Candidatus Lokiarchaeota archaeon]|nr:hypothetical protein [Candidatus Lokiarchaeota archaeon]